ncbi:undecaprenyl/decaprenyl-phosphate alpha-N-acetylglucosaminyl 1-phosphate transferase [Agrococcus sediminis]|uniref:Undecaprenyl/decaprenyl-phosphate alpha-N-acetylglucosaminyl 1-phosphate transferase n=1 Tax=Agrococcus sediminis TaxID=2599924 RepID=A0A5M8Q886_9MICO|nr:MULTISPECIES: MraY family glycosyltransferase [Agrococcus]KAA6432137.1 undecaprenyl/decaprenyl-phosphate alpha-N-acetylglucosaminyl 1-phosphate transferase [Agrococcus sediminis]RWR20714.1 undecaprenyl/decaprenyl-phosphate alpha-N-acetylglucosaminyl 1-phosphate transferase [Agrococcus lahaulensis]UOW00044.1 undecaprenyl/decaprenyl-phosphate alpha-N-acetylglucosaminyl 1-phosphate transferase [Agrococcus sp. SCSIO52902]
MIFLLITAVAAVVTFVATRVVLAVALKHGIHPPVRDRDVHSRPTPRLGGVAMCIGVLGAFGVAALIPELSGVFAEPARIWTLLAGAVAICGIGVLDDLVDLDWMLKLGAQILVATGVALFGVQIVSLPIAGITVPSATTAIMLTVLIIVLVMNALNFIDGLDGLVAGTTIIGSTAFFGYIFIISQNLGQQNAYFSLASLITSIIVGVCLGFLPVNWHPARMFMGDGGALMLGLLTAASAIAVTGQIDIGTMGGRSQILPAFIPVLLPLAILLLPLTDFVLAVVRRLLNGSSPFAADRKHLHHRLLDMGHSHLGAVLIFYAWTAVVSVGCLVFLMQPWWVAVGIMAVGFIVCALLTAAPVSRRVWRTFLRVLRERRAARRGLEPTTIDARVETSIDQGESR